MTDTANKPERKKLSIGGSRPKLGLKPSTSKPAGEQKADPVLTRRKKKVVVVGKPATKPSRKPPRKQPEDPELKAKREADAKTKQKETLEIEAAKRRVILAKRWLMNRFPEIFHPESPKPLARGIAKDIEDALREDGAAVVLGFGRKPLQKALGQWVHSIPYLEACLAKGAVRHAINPDAPAEALVITPEDRKAFKFRLKVGKKKAEQKKKKRGGSKKKAPKAKR